MKFYFVLIPLFTVKVLAGKFSEPAVFTGTCDASAAVSISGDLFVVANDEDNLLRFYRFSQPGPPVQTFDLKPLFTTKRKAPEADLEGAARIGALVYFISSHGANAEGKAAPGRQRLFALGLTASNSAVTVAAVGQPYTRLVADLAQHPLYRQFELEAAAGRPPKSPGGFNIEALAATPEGALLIGFRSPIPQGRALIAPLLNPRAVLDSQPPEFAPPQLLDLGGLGLRDLFATTNGYYLIAGPDAGNAESQLYFWPGGSATPRHVPGVHFPRSNPEAICYLNFGSGADYLILSDDGTRKIGGQECKKLPEAQRQFRAYRFTPD